MKPLLEMNAEEKGLAHRWMETWKQAGPMLEEERTKEIRATDTIKAMEMLDGMFTHAAQSMPMRESSGLIEQQIIFARARR